jgi:hypothetical protein
MEPMTTAEQALSATKARLVPADIEDRHASLYQEVLDSKDELSKNPDVRDHLIRRINEFVADMKAALSELEAQGDYAAEYDWLERTATKWQGVFSWIFSEPRNIRAEINLPKRRPGVIGSRERAEIPADQISRDIETLAYHIGQDRKLADLTRQIEELERRRERIHTVIPSNPEDEVEDWYNAMAYFAANVFFGRIDLPYQLSADSYGLLEQVHLDEVKRLKAYHLWKEAGSVVADADKDRHYLDGCEQIRQMLLNLKMKTPALDFAHLRSFLTEKYLTVDGGVGGPAVEDLQRTKAWRIWNSTSRHGHHPQEQDWELAGQYIELLYGNLVDAIEGNPESVGEVLEALGEPWRGYRVINCLEAAIAISFLSPALIRRWCEDEMDIV